MTGRLALGIAWAALCILLGVICWPIAYRRGLKDAAEDARDDATALTIASWKGLADEDAPPSPPWPAAPPREAPRAGPGKHRHPAGPRHAALPEPADGLATWERDLLDEQAARGPCPAHDVIGCTVCRTGAPPQHAALPAAGYLPAEPSPWAATMTLPAPGQAPPWDIRPPEPQTEVLEPTAADCLRPDALTDTGWTRQMARAMAEDMDRDIERMEQDMGAWIAEHIAATDSTLKEITR